MDILTIFCSSHTNANEQNDKVNENNINGYLLYSRYICITERVLTTRPKNILLRSSKMLQDTTLGTGFRPMET